MLSIKNKIGVLLLLVYCTNGTLLTSEGMCDSHDDTNYQEPQDEPKRNNPSPYQPSPQPYSHHSLIKNVQPTPTESNQIFTKARNFLGCVLPAALVTPAALAFAKGQPIVDSNRIGKAVANFWQGATTYLPCLADTANWAHVPVFLSAQVAASYGLHTYFYTDKRIKNAIAERYRSKCFFHSEKSDKDELSLYDVSSTADSNMLKKGLNLSSFQNASITLIKDEGLQNNSSNNLKTIEDYAASLNERYNELETDEGKNQLEGEIRRNLNSAYTEFMREFFCSEIKYSSFNKHAATNIGVTALLLALAYLYKKENLSLKTNATIFFFSTAISVYYSFILASFTNEKIAKIAKETIYTSTEIDSISSNQKIQQQIITPLIYSMKNAKTDTL